MWLRALALGIAAGLAILVLGFSFSVVGRIIDVAFDTWYVGVGLVVAAIVIGRSGRSPQVAAALGLIGIAWITIWVTTIGMVLFLISVGGWGY